MEITIETLEAQIEVWANEKAQATAEIDMLNNQKNQTVGKINYLEGSIQSYRVLIAQIENGAGADMPAPGNEQEQGNGDTEAHQSAIESEVG